MDQPADPQGKAEEDQTQVQQVALAVEQFLQTSTVGEYEQRLSMVWSFRHVSLPLPSNKSSQCKMLIGAVIPCCFQFLYLTVIAH